ncbi:TPA: hypothetical protein U2J51_000865 [Acinetobacter nosocomialis]|nr:hypothetical protein [Acinetobacter nosocomialis]
MGSAYIDQQQSKEKPIDELRHFPNGTHDDQVDAASDAFNELHEGFETFFADMGFAR